MIHERGSRSWAARGLLRAAVVVGIGAGPVWAGGHHRATVGYVAAPAVSTVAVAAQPVVAAVPVGSHHGLFHHRTYGVSAPVMAVAAPTYQVQAVAPTYQMQAVAPTYQVQAVAPMYQVQAVQAPAYQLQAVPTTTLQWVPAGSNLAATGQATPSGDLLQLQSDSDYRVLASRMGDNRHFSGLKDHIRVALKNLLAQRGRLVDSGVLAQILVQVASRFLQAEFGFSLKDVSDFSSVIRKLIDSLINEEGAGDNSGQQRGQNQGQGRGQGQVPSNLVPLAPGTYQIRGTITIGAASGGDSSGNNQPIPNRDPQQLPSDSEDVPLPEGPDVAPPPSFGNP